MGTFEGHLAHGIGLMAIGFWHVLNTARNYARSPPDQFESRPWFIIANAKEGRFINKYLELHAIMLFAAASITTELFVSPDRHRPWDSDWSIPLSHMNNVEHSTIAIFFFLYAFVALVVDRSQVQAPRGLIHALGALAFAEELLLFHFHSTDHAGLEGHYHWLLQVVVGISLASTLVEAALPRNPLVALVRSSSVLFQGVWLVHMAFSLWIPACLPKGCALTKRNNVDIVKCQSSDLAARAQGIANLQFSWDLFLVLLTTLVILFYCIATVKQSYQPLNFNGEELIYHQYFKSGNGQHIVGFHRAHSASLSSASSCCGLEDELGSFET